MMFKRRENLLPTGTYRNTSHFGIKKLHVALLTFCFVTAAYAAQPYTVSTAGNGIPSGAVVAFYTACPAGWAAYTNASGRVIVGTGGGYGLGATGGAAMVTLTIAQMPKHQHAETFAKHIGAAPAQYGLSTDKSRFGYELHGIHNGVWVTQPLVSPAGGSQPFDNRQPYLALNYCYKL